MDVRDTRCSMALYSNSMSVPIVLHTLLSFLARRFWAIWAIWGIWGPDEEPTNCSKPPKHPQVRGFEGDRGKCAILDPDCPDPLGVLGDLGFGGLNEEPPNPQYPRTLKNPRRLTIKKVILWPRGSQPYV